VEINSKSGFSSGFGNSCANKVPENNPIMGSTFKKEMAFIANKLGD
jgi:hypothetical protein